MKFSATARVDSMEKLLAPKRHTDWQPLFEDAELSMLESVEVNSLLTRFLLPWEVRSEKKIGTSRHAPLLPCIFPRA